MNIEDTIQNISEILYNRIIDKNYSCCCIDKISFIKRRILVYYLFLTTDMNIIDIEKEVMQKYNITIF